LLGASGLIPTPRKIAGSEIKMIDELMVAIKIPKVVLVKAIHLYRGETVLLSWDLASVTIAPYHSEIFDLPIRLAVESK